jgi:hypothetical protein
MAQGGAVRISQREARRLQKRVSDLEQMLRDIRTPGPSLDYPGGVNVATETGVGERTRTAIQTSMKLGHVVICAVRNTSDNAVAFFALPAPRS